MSRTWLARVVSTVLAAALASAGPSQAAGVKSRAEPWDPPRIVELAAGETLPSPEELEARGARVGEILVRVYDIFNTSDPREDNWFYRTANALHYMTRQQTVVEQLTFERGRPLKAQRLAESERVLRGRRYLFDAVVRVARYDEAANVADIEVSVRDVWTLNPGLSYSNTGGRASRGMEIEELNLLGRGQKLQFSYDDDIDRTSYQLQWLNPNLLDSRWELAVSYADLSDGQTQFLALERPFYSLDSRWAAGGFVLDDTRVTRRYDLGKPVDAFEVDSTQFDLHYGWSPGLVEGSARRWLVGLRQDQQAFALAAGEVPPPEFPADRKFIYPWAGVEWVEDAYEKVRNRNQIGRTEDLFLGTRWRATLGYAGTGMGSSADAWLFAGTMTSTRRYRPRLEWSLDATARGRLQSGRLRDAVLTAQGQHYWRIDRHQTVYASLTGTVTEELDADRQLLLGAEEGLRGYPLRYLTGTSSALLTLEHRLYTDWYPFRLFNVGAAAFYDAGRTWGPTLDGTRSEGWLSDLGVGLRLGTSRSGIGSVVHIDFTYALEPIPGKDRFVITVATRRGF